MVNVENSLGREAPARQPGASALMGTTLYTYRGHAGRVHTVAWSPDGSRIASGGDDNTVHVWNASSGAHIFIYRGHRNWHEAGWSDQSLGMSGKWIPAAAGTVAWSPDGSRLASGGWDHLVRVWDVLTGSHIFTYTGHTSWVNAATWSPDGSRIASADQEGIVRVWDAIPRGNTFIYCGHASSVNAVAWSPDGTRIASASDDKTVQLWDAIPEGNTFIYRGHAGRVNAVAWSPDGSRIASASDDKTVQVWKAT
jgi:eukaryotic-like serine/threonine-protein kinase